MTGLSACEYCRLATCVRLHARVIARMFGITAAYAGNGSALAPAPASTDDVSADGLVQEAACICAAWSCASTWFHSDCRFWSWMRSSLQRRFCRLVRSLLTWFQTCCRMNVFLSGPLDMPDVICGKSCETVAAGLVAIGSNQLPDRS